jgi:hypothetical protein
MTELLADVTLSVAGFALLMVAVYVIARVWSVAHFRSRAEYDRGDWNKYGKREDSNG